jgi:RHS repeat-associated protein
VSNIQIRKNQNAGHQNADLDNGSVHIQDYTPALDDDRATWQRAWESEVGTTAQNDFETVTKQYVVDYTSGVHRDILIIENGSFEQRYVYGADAERLSAEFSYADGTERGTTNVDGEYGENLASDFSVNDITKVWYRVNMLGTSLYVVDASYTIRAHAEYDIWGDPLTETYADANYSGLEELVSFTSYAWDITLELYFAQNRFYDADEHRFTQQDPTKDGGNWYVYCGANPLIATDPLGLLAVMKYGEGSPVDIQEMQNILFYMGYFGWTWDISKKEKDENITDGIWGNQTLVALIRFQITFAHFAWNDLFDSVTGEYYGVGESTLEKLKQVQRALPVFWNTELSIWDYYQKILCIGKADPQTYSGQLINEPHVVNPMVYITISGNVVKNNSNSGNINSENGGYSSFLRTLGMRESTTNYRANRAGYLGMYQLGEGALVDAGYYGRDGKINNNFSNEYWTKKANSYGVYSVVDFLASSTAQEDAVRIYHKAMWGYIENVSVHKQIGKTYNGIYISASGLLGAAHLVGHIALRDMFKNGTNPRDELGTTASEYLELLSGYDLTDLLGRNPDKG